jgi:Mn2+/Fe2+ NRAMP family transporter
VASARRLGLTTGKGLASLIRENFRLRTCVFVVLATCFANWATVVAEFAGIASVAHLYGIPRFILIAVSCAFISSLVIQGSFKIVQRVFLTSSLMYLSFIFAGFAARPDWTAVARGFVIPSLSLAPGFLFTIIAIIGTTVTAWGQFFVQSYYVDKGVKAHNLRLVRWDIAAGVFWTVVVACFIIIAAAATLWSRGIPITQAGDAAVALEPLLGPIAKHLFAWGFLNASLLGASVVAISASYLITESFGWEGELPGWGVVQGESEPANDGARLIRGAGFPFGCE